MTQRTEKKSRLGRILRRETVGTVLITLRRNAGWYEYLVVVSGGTTAQLGTYHTSDKVDALETFDSVVNRIKTSQERYS